MSFRVNVYRPSGEQSEFKPIKKKKMSKAEMVLEYLEENGTISTSEAMQLCGYKSRGAARNVLSTMADDNLIICVGKGAQIHYEKK